MTSPSRPHDLTVLELLREDRATRAARHDDRTFRTERAARADGNGSGNRFEDCDLRMNLAPAKENCFEGFRNSVSANFFRAITRHQADDDRSNDWNDNDPHAKMMPLGQGRRRRESLKEREIGDDRD